MFCLLVIKAGERTFRRPIQGDLEVKVAPVNTVHYESYNNYRQWCCLFNLIRLTTVRKEAADSNWANKITW